MMKIKPIHILTLILATSVYGAVYKEGKTVMDKDYKVDIVKMQWGIKDKETDRLIGKARLYGLTYDAYSDITLTFDVYGRGSVSNDSAKVKQTGMASPKAEKIDTFECTFNFRKYGYKKAKEYVEGDFCVDFAKFGDAGRLELSNIKVTRVPVTYCTKFNITSSLIKSNFQIPEPKAVPQTR